LGSAIDLCPLWLIVNVTPLEPEWRAGSRLEIANACSTPMKVYAHEGICQFMFVRGEHYRRSAIQTAREISGSAGATLAQV